MSKSFSDFVGTLSQSQLDEIAEKVRGTPLLGPVQVREHGGRQMTEALAPAAVAIVIDVLHLYHDWLHGKRQP